MAASFFSRHLFFLHLQILSYEKVGYRVNGLTIEVFHAARRKRSFDIIRSVVSIESFEAGEDLRNTVGIFVADDDRYIGVRVGNKKVDSRTIYFFVGENILFG